MARAIPFFAAAEPAGTPPQNGWCQPVAMKNSIGIDSIVLVRDARNASAARLGLLLVGGGLHSEDLLADWAR